MVIQINQPVENDFRNPLGLLTDCHRRIEGFLNVLTTISAKLRGEPLDAERREAFDIALRYFRDAAPLHTFDEENSLFPRMREKRNRINENELGLLDELHAEHCSAEHRHEQVDHIGRKWLENGELSSGDAGILIDLLENLSQAYCGHISLEEQKVFPLAASILDVTELNAIAEEMAARRGVTLKAQT